MEFYELNIWIKGKDLLLQIYELTDRYPKSEKYGLISQTRNSANSIIAQIAESCGRYSFIDKIRVLRQARGECFETRSHLMVASELKYVDKSKADILDVDYSGLAKGINTYIKSLERYTNRKSK